MPKQITIGTRQGVAIDVAAWDGVMAEVDLSCACMFTYELQEGLVGGLRHLDDALSGALVRWRHDGIFRAEPMETLRISEPPATVKAAAVMVIGMGEPLVWTTAVTARAAATALRAAVHHGATSAAFAPSLLDSGLSAKATECAATAMLKAVVDAIDAQATIAAQGFAPSLSLRRWVFDVGAAHFDAVAAQFREVFDAL